jgi:hypothetical protein
MDEKRIFNTTFPWMKIHNHSFSFQMIYERKEEEGRS